MEGFTDLKQSQALKELDVDKWLAARPCGYCEDGTDGMDDCRHCHGSGRAGGRALCGTAGEPYSFRGG